MEQKDEVRVRLGFVVAEFNRDITYPMEILAEEHAAFLGADVVKTILVPRVFDMPLAVKSLATDNEVDAVVTIGCVIEGATAHDEIVAQHATRKITDLALGTTSRSPWEYQVQECPALKHTNASTMQKEL